MKKYKINANGTEISVLGNVVDEEAYISLTDIAKYKNPDFKPTEFGRFREESGLNAFVLSPTKWIAATNAIGIIAQSGRYGGTYARSDIAFKFAAWLSVEFELYLVKEFQRLKAKEQELIGWSAKRELAKINYRIHTDAIQQNLIPASVTRAQMNIIYASEMRPRRRRLVVRRAERGVLRGKIVRGRAGILYVDLLGTTHQQ